MKKLFGIVVLGLFLIIGKSNAALNGIDKINILLEDLGEHAEKCGLSESEITTSIKYILQNSKIKIVPLSDYKEPTLYVRVFLGFNESGGGFCYGSAKLEVYQLGSYNGRQADIVYYSNSRIAAGGNKDAFGNFVIGQIESMTKRFVVKWSEVN